MHELDQMLQLQLKGKHVEARALSDKLEALGPDKILDPEGKNTSDIWMRHSFNRGWFLLQEGKYQEGCQLLENGRFLNVYGSPPLQTRAPIFNPETHEIEGKSIILSMEGGYGDEIIHARFATSFKELGADKVYIAAAPELVSLFERIEGVDKVITRDQTHAVAHDYWVPGFSAGWVAGHTFEDLPSGTYLTARQESVTMWGEVIKNNNKPKIGIRWAGNPKFEHQQFRRFPVNFITNLKSYSDQADIYSFQRDHNTVNLPEGIIDLQFMLPSWEDTAAAIMNLDLVITSCTSVAHLAAALGKETWVIVPCLPYHTWTWQVPDSTTTPYYKNVRLFRQQEFGTWNDVFQRVYEALEEKFQFNHVELPNEDKEPKRLHLGCGFKKIPGYTNVDISPYVKPDEIVDLNVTPWPWEDNTYTHIVAKDVLEHLGEDTRHFLDIIKEMYRVSENGAVWEISVPHWRCDTALDDPHHKRLLTYGFFLMLDQRRLMDEKIQQGQSDTLLAFEEGIDVSVVDVQFVYTPHWYDKVQSGEIDQKELVYALNHYNNVASSMVLLMQVHKPTRYTQREFIDAIESQSI